MAGRWLAGGTDALLRSWPAFAGLAGIAEPRRFCEFASTGRCSRTTEAAGENAVRGPYGSSLLSRDAPSSQHAITPITGNEREHDSGETLRVRVDGPLLGPPMLAAGVLRRVASTA
ncbi:hypothetical protein CAUPRSCDRAFT_11422 [Caulochytrium protostelioides]|uniref:Uncharacterized protein n=1 Tax=Caulochytrium protostelioides TaxID=1555241 RepID=A0A4P9WUE8_9FUNG|nr:hypothetical protein CAUPRSCDRAFT_11422 [Caulochytrium protostelioides]